MRCISGSSRDSRRRLGRRALLLAICCCYASLLTTVQAQTGAQEERSDNQALELKLRAYESRVCQGSSLTLSLEIANTGQEELKIYKPSLWSDLSYSAEGRKVSGSSTSCGVDDGRAENWVVLEPGAQYHDTLTYSFEWNDFFQAAGRYKISTSLPYYARGNYSRTVSSNRAEFEVYDCAAK